MPITWKLIIDASPLIIAFCKAKIQKMCHARFPNVCSLPPQWPNMVYHHLNWATVKEGWPLALQFLKGKIQSTCHTWLPNVCGPLCGEYDFVCRSTQGVLRTMDIVRPMGIGVTVAAVPIVAATSVVGTFWLYQHLRTKHHSKMEIKHQSQISDSKRKLT